MLKFQKAWKSTENQLEAKKNTNLLQKFIAQFKDLMIIVLLAAALVSVFVGEGVDAIIILLVVVLNAIFGVFQEAKAEQAIDALKELSAPQAHVKRNGKVVTIKSEDVVPGDIVLFRSWRHYSCRFTFTRISGFKDGRISFNW